MLAPAGVVGEVEDVLPRGGRWARTARYSATWPQAWMQPENWEFETHSIQMGVNATDRPLCVPSPSIEDFRDLTWNRLSDRALDGFIGRAEAGGLSVPDGFLKALRDANRKVPDPPLA